MTGIFATVLADIAIPLPISPAPIIPKDFIVLNSLLA